MEECPYGHFCPLLTRTVTRNRVCSSGELKGCNPNWLRKEVVVANPLNVIQHFQQALGKGDFTAARHLLHDNLSFRGPIDTFHKPEPYLEALKKLQPIIQRIDLLKMFADGNDVCVLYDMVTNTPIGTAFVCEWYQVKGEKISSVRIVFDARPFAAMFANEHHAK